MSHNRPGKRERLYAMQGGLCAHRCKPMKPKHVTLEHVTPRADGGTDAWTNLLAAHKWCNERRDRGPLWRRARAMHKAVLSALADPAGLEPATVRFEAGSSIR